MSKTETRKLQRRCWQLRITRRQKTPEYRTLMGTLMLGSIAECRCVANLMDTGNETARMMAEFMRHRALHITHQLRQL